MIGDITIQVADNGRLMFDAPPEVFILREELVNDLRQFHCRIGPLSAPITAKSALAAAEKMVKLSMGTVGSLPTVVIVTSGNFSRAFTVGVDSVGKIRVLI